MDNNALSAEELGLINVAFKCMEDNGSMTKPMTNRRLRYMRKGKSREEQCKQCVGYAEYTNQCNNNRQKFQEETSAANTSATD